MISLSVQAAVNEFQQQAMSAHDGYLLDRIDRALDELVRNPGKTAPAAFQRRSAMANANKILQARQRAVTFVSINQEIDTGEHVRVIEVAAADSQPDLLDIHLWLETTPSLTALQRTILRALAAGEDAESLAVRYDVPVSRMRERISRAREVGWTAYRTEVGAG